MADNFNNNFRKRDMKKNADQAPPEPIVGPTEVVGVNFRRAGKIYYFAPRGLAFKIGENVIVETSRGLEYGTVIMPATDAKIDEPHKNGLEVSYIDGKIGYCLSANGNQYSNSFYESKTEIKEMMMCSFSMSCIAL